MPSDMSYAQQLNAAHKARRSRMYAAAYVEPEIKTSPPLLAAKPPAPPPFVFVIVNKIPLPQRPKTTAQSILTLDFLDKEQKLKLSEVMMAVLDVVKISKKELMSTRRLRNIVIPRQIFYYLAKKHTFASFPAMGRRMGGYDHSTVMHGVMRIKEMVDDGDENVIRIIEAVEKLLGVTGMRSPAV
jgi:Bacterial dnaA protein helix-turn-helix